MNVKIKKMNDVATIPKYAKDGDAGLDLMATRKTLDEKKKQITYGTGISLEIPNGYVGLLFPRSSICKTDLSLSNCVGVIDSSYRGEVTAVFNYSKKEERELVDYAVGERVVQLIIIPYPQIEFEEVEELSGTERGESGYGSTGK